MDDVMTRRDPGVRQGGAWRSGVSAVSGGLASSLAGASVLGLTGAAIPVVLVAGVIGGALAWSLTNRMPDPATTAEAVDPKG